VKVTVFDVTLAGTYSGGQAADNDKKHSTFGGSSDRNGIISWDDANGDGTKGDMDANCVYFHNCTEWQGTVKPTGVTTQVAFDIKRDKWRRVWVKTAAGQEWTLAADATPWEDDTSPAGAKDLTVSGNDHIYDIDGPGFTTKSRTPYNYYFYAGCFREYCVAQIYGRWFQVSDFGKWHAQTYLVPKNATELTRGDWNQQKLGGGWITVPNTPPVNP